MSSPLKQIHLAGKGYDLGLAHGKALKSEIHEMLGILHRILRNPRQQSIQRGLLQYGHQHVMGAIRYQWLVKAAHKLLPYIAREYIDEMKGIAAGAGVRFDDILVINTYDDLLYLAGCSSVCSKTSDGNILHARNLD